MRYIGNAFSLGMVPRHLLAFVRLSACGDRKSTRLNSSHQCGIQISRMPSSA